ncbi:MAG TPA: FAD-dependent oxidoreductase [Candidatus Saccharibacteria bacterium]|nr:FAD-dependent oxidoreductase [Candidatus Saccharibacteria bacterium]
MSVDHDVVMIGAGPSALTAAIYTTREEIDTVLFEKSIAGGLAATTDWIDNYPGYSKGIEGIKLADELRQQAERFGAKLSFKEIATLRRHDNHIQLTTTKGDVLSARAVLIATGSNHRTLNVPGENEYYSRGVHYCATCDGAFYKNRRIAVVGGGNSAVQEAIFLTRFASHVDLLVRSKLRASEVLQEKLATLRDKITVHLETATDEVVATDDVVTGVRVTSGNSSRVIPVDGVFIFVGLIPNTQFLKDTPIELDKAGHIKTDNNLETAMPGVFAAGDVRSRSTAQIASAVGDGATAALRIREYLEAL